MQIFYIDLFSGCGGFALGLKQAGFKHRVHLYSEIDKYKIMVYRKHFPDAVNLGDIRHVKTKQIKHIISAHGTPHLITFGWPCQDSSRLGKGRGLMAGRKSSLFFDAIRIIEKMQPRHIIAENVAGLRDRGDGTDLIEAIRSMSFLSKDLPQYHLEMQLFDSRFYTAQSRPRLYFCGHIRGKCTGEIFPLPQKSRVLIKKSSPEKRQFINCMSARYGVSGNQVEHSILETKDGRHRRFTPLEVERFQGYPDHFTALGIDDKGLEKKISDSQRWAMLGDAVTVPIVKEIAAELKKVM